MLGGLVSEGKAPVSGRGADVAPTWPTLSLAQRRARERKIKGGFHLVHIRGMLFLNANNKEVEALGGTPSEQS